MIRRHTGTANDFVAQQNALRKGMGVETPYAPDGKPVVIPSDFGAVSSRAAMAQAFVFPEVGRVNVQHLAFAPLEHDALIAIAKVVSPDAFLFFSLAVIEHGGVGEALSRAIVADAEQLGLSRLLALKSKARKE